MKRLPMPTIALTTLKIVFTLFCCTVLMVFVAPAQTIQSIKEDPGTNNPPPAGAILDLNGTPIPGGGDGTFQRYTVNFTATLTSTAITFAFREDPAFISFADASVVDVTTESGNLLVNGNFSGGVYSDPVSGNSFVPNGWTYANVYGAFAGGVVQPGCGRDEGYCWYDGAVQAYDAISQTIPTTVGDTYQISFWVADNSGCFTEGDLPCNFSDLSTNGDTTGTGGNGINVTVYAQAGLPPPPQNTLTLTELGLGDGTVTDNTEQINCSESNGVVTGTCSATYENGTIVTLTATLNSETTTFGGWGGACASFGTNLTCTLTMDSAQNVAVSFNAPGPTQAGTVTTGVETFLNFDGGFDNGGFNYNAELTSGSPVLAQVVAIPIQDQTTCNTIVQANPIFQGAQCFVYQNVNGPGTKAPVMFELTCPDSAGGTCGSINLPNFLAELGTDYNFALTDNTGFNKSNPLPGWLKGVGPDPTHPCTQNPNNNPPLFQSNQIDSFSITGDPGGHAKGSSGGTGSCWLLTYNTPNEAPTVNIVAPVNGGTYQQGQPTQANYTCTTVNNSNVNNGVAGPYLTQSSCSAIDSPGGFVAQGAQFDTNTPGLHTFTATVVDSATDNASQTVTYNVVGSTDVAILKLAPRKIRTGSKLTYVIGVGDLGNTNAVNVRMNDPLPPGTAFLNASGTNVACSVVKGKPKCSTTPVPCVYAGGTVSCNVGAIMPLSVYPINGAIMQITVQVTAASGTLTNTATVSADNTDPNPTNNSSTANTIVTAQ
jgi:uncharacterized repeat protein (TIGR01451 family)